MRAFRVGEFQREHLRGFYRPFCPARAFESVTEIGLDGLKLRGKKLILLDVDNTIVHWRQENFEPEVVAWIERAKAIGFQLAILSNTRHPERLNRIAETLGVPVIRGRFKPSTEMYRAALERFDCEPSEAIMVGDQLFTDVLGANRSGIEAIWVHQRSPRDFIGTKLSRLGERFMRSKLYRVLVDAETPVEGIEADGLGASQAPSLKKQLFRFIVVGASSFLIDFCLRYFFIFVLSWQGELVNLRVGRWLQEHYPNLVSSDVGTAAGVVFIPLAALIAMYNSFFWNRRWTFEIQSKEDRARQLVKFYVVSVAGLILNSVISNALFNIVPGHKRWSLAVATVVAAGVVAAWNFLGQRLFAFRERRD